MSPRFVVRAVYGIVSATIALGLGGCNGAGIGGGDVTAPVALPTFSPNGGTFTEPVTVRLACEAQGAVIRYSANGNDPAGTGVIYDPNSPPILSQTATMRAVTVTADGRTSSVVSASFTIQPSAQDPNTPERNTPDPAEMAPILAVPNALNFGCLETSRTLALTYRVPAETAWQVQTDPAAPWLTVADPATQASSRKAVSGTGNVSLTVTADRSGLTQGTHTTQLTVTCSAETLTIPVFVSVPPTHSLPFDSQTNQYTLKAENGSAYRISDMIASPCGRYIYALATDSTPDVLWIYAYLLILRTSDHSIESTIALGPTGSPARIRNEIGCIDVSPDGQYVYVTGKMSPREFGDEAWSSNDDLGLCVVRTSDHTVAACIPEVIGRVIANPNGRYVYVMAGMKGEICVVRTSDFTVSKRIDPSILTGQTSRTTAGLWSLLAIAPDGNELYVSQWNIAGERGPSFGWLMGQVISVIRTSDHAVTEHAAIPGTVQGKAAISPDGKRLYASLAYQDGLGDLLQASEDLLVFRIQDRAVEKTVPFATTWNMHANWKDVCVSPDGQYVYVSALQNRLEVIRASDLKPLNDIVTAGIDAMAITADGRRLCTSGLVKDGVFGQFAIGEVESDQRTLPLVSVSPDALDFGDHETERTIQLTNIGTGPLRWNISKDSTLWLGSMEAALQVNEDQPDANSVAGAGDATVKIKLNRQDVPNGIYQGQLRVSDGWQEQMIPISATLCPGGADYPNLLIACGYRGKTPSLEPYGYYFGGVVPSPTRGIVYVTPRSAFGGSVLAVQVPDFKVLQSLHIDGVLTGDLPDNSTQLALALSPDGQYLLVSNPDTDSVTVVRTGDFQILGTVPVAPLQSGRFSYHTSCMAITTDGQYAYVGRQENDRVSVIDISDRTLVGNVPVTGQVQAIVSAAGNIYVGSVIRNDVTTKMSANITVIRASDHSVLASVPINQASSFDRIDLAASPDGSKIYCTAGLSLWVLKTAENQLAEQPIVDESRIERMGETFYHITASPDGRYLYLLGFRHLFVIRTSNYAIADVIEMPAPCQDQMTVTPDGDYVVVAGAGLSIIGHSPGDDSWISVSPDILDFGPAETEKRLSLVNHGPRTLDWTLQVMNRYFELHLLRTTDGSELIDNGTGGGNGSLLDRGTGSGSADFIVKIKRSSDLTGEYPPYFVITDGFRRIVIPLKGTKGPNPTPTPSISPPDPCTPFIPKTGTSGMKGLE